MKIELIADEYVKLDIVPALLFVRLSPHCFRSLIIVRYYKLYLQRPIVNATRDLPYQIEFDANCFRRPTNCCFQSNRIIFDIEFNFNNNKIEAKHSAKCVLNAINFATLIIIEGEICYSFFDLLRRKTQFADRGMKLKKFSVIYLDRSAMPAA